MESEVMHVQNQVQNGLPLDSRVTNLEIRMAVAESNIDTISKKLDKIDSGINKVLWLITSTIIIALLGFILKGGLNL